MRRSVLMSFRGINFLKPPNRSSLTVSSIYAHHRLLRHIDYVSAYVHNERFKLSAGNLKASSLNGMPQIGRRDAERRRSPVSTEPRETDNGRQPSFSPPRYSSLNIGTIGFLHERTVCIAAFRTAGLWDNGSE